MYHFILNPAAGKGKSLRAMKKVEKLLCDSKIHFEVHNTISPQDAVRLVSELTTAGAENVIAVGGDGTMNEVLNGIADFETCRLGCIPCGTGNDFAKFAGLPKDPVKAMNIILKNEPQYTDFLTLGDKRVMNITGMGIDVAVLDRCKRMKFFKGKIQYLLSLVISLFKLKWFKFTVSVDGGPEEEKTVLIAAACNGKYFGGGMPVSPESDLTDNKLNLIIVNRLPRWRVPFCLISLLRGKILKYKFVENILCETCTIKTADGKTLINMDGELYRDVPFDCALVKGKLKMFR